MKSSGQLLLLGVLTALPTAAAAAESAIGSVQPTPPDTSQWKCESCKFEQGQSGTLEAGVGSVSDNSAKFGEYTGLHKDGAFFIGEGSLRFRAPDGAYWTANASNLGLDSRSLNAEGGLQGKYKLLFGYDELPHFVSDSAQTPFAGVGGASLTLPAGFPAATTAAMPLAGTLQPVDISTKRKRVGLGGSWIPARDWEYGVNFRHETREGTKRTAGAFFINSAQLIEPVDYTTDQIDASASYTGAGWQAKFAYYGSIFRNSNNALTWQNPFSSVVPGDSSGQLALPPDNQFHQVLASLGYQVSDRTRVSADVAIGRMTQNESFLAPTLNTTTPGLLQPLPAGSPDARADTMNVGVKLVSAVTDRLRLNALVTRDDRDNKTSQLTYPVVSTDMFGPTPRTNLPYSFKQEKGSLSADYRFTERIRGSAGMDLASYKRYFQEALRTREQTAWGKVSSRVVEGLDMMLKLARGERRISGYQPAPGITPPENPLLRKYNMADRTRDTVGLRADISAIENIGIGLGLDTSKDTYLNSPIGLTSGRDSNVNGDISVKLAEHTTLQLFAVRQVIKSRQAGSETFSTPDWFAKNVDKINVVGVGVRQTAIMEKLDVGADYTVSRMRSEINVDAGTGNGGFPELFSSLNSLKLYASYRLKDNLSLNAGYWHEFYNTRNWMLDGVAPATIANVLTLGEQPPRYNLNVIKLSMRYSF